MNNDEIKKGLKCCVGLVGIKDCVNCPYVSIGMCTDTLCKEALNLITKQEQEIGWSKTELTKLKSKANDYKQRYESSKKRYFELTQSGCEALRAKDKHFQEKCKKVENNMKAVFEKEKKQAVKEFAEKLKAKAVQEAEVEDYVCYIVNRLLKEYEK